MKTKDQIIFGAKRAGVTYLFGFDTQAELDQTKAAAKRLGLTLSELLCRAHPGITGAPELPEPRKFTYEDRKASTLKIQITECDEFTRACLERQADLWGGASVEEYMLNNVFMTLENDEDNALLDPQTGDVILEGHELWGFLGCKVDKDAQTPPPSHFSRRPIPAGTVVETCA
jgi:hypothetical protein